MTLANRPTTAERELEAARSAQPESLSHVASRLMSRTIPDRMWGTLRGLPVVRDWKVLSDALFLGLSFGLGLLWFIVIATLGAVGVATLVVWVGIPILAALFALVIWGAQYERSRIRVFLGIDIPTPYRYIPAEGKPWKRAWGLLGNRQLWRDFAYLALLLPMGFLGLLVLWLPFPFLFAPFVYFAAGPTDVWSWDVNHAFEALMASLLGLILILPTAALINITANLNGRLAQKLLAPSVEEVLTERVEELTESRSAVMRAMHLERRRIERDLHDGAQQRLVSLAMELGLAREKMESDPEAARKLIEASHEDAKLVLAELRDLVRGIHPAVLTDRGLDAAISAIAGRSPIPITVDVNLPRRLPEEVEGTAYFVVVEALTNVAKHSGATSARVAIRLHRGWLMLEVSDNGKGGADPDLGSGLRGLRDRIVALDGTFDFASPAGKGTTIKVAIPAQ